MEVIAKALVEHPEEVAVTEREEERTIVVELKVAPFRYGKSDPDVRGRIAKKRSRTVVKSASSKCDKKVIVDIM